MPTTIRRNLLRERLASDDPLLGVADGFRNPNIVEFLGYLGLDFVWLDLEHGGPSAWSTTTIEHYVRAAELSEVGLIVRVPSPDPALLRKTLDAGVRNVLVPRVETAEEVRRAVAAGRYHYDGGVGDRGLSAERVSQWGLDTDDHLAREDRSVLVGVMLENERAIDDVEEIVSVPELGFAFVGRYDLSVDVVGARAPDHPDVEAAADRALAACEAADVPACAIAREVDDAIDAFDTGYRMVHVDNTINAIGNAFTEWMDAFERAR